MNVRFTLRMKASISLAIMALTYSGAALAWTATYLGGQKWAITCANGQSFSYSGSSAGLDYVGPALCPGGKAAPPRWKFPGVTQGVPANHDRDILANKKEIGEAKQGNEEKSTNKALAQ
ncbi:MAG: hypothetical protein ACJ8HJ_21720 [Massilia sp.]